MRRLVIEFTASRPFRGLRRRWLTARTRDACRVLGVGEGELSIRLADDAEMSRLHEQHKTLTGPTDVLTFDFTESGAWRQGHLEAEIVIGAQRAQCEAERRGCEPAVEAMLYIVHGLLHCLGYDDHDARAAAAMHRREDEVLTIIGVGPAYGGRIQRPSRRRL